MLQFWCFHWHTWASCKIFNPGLRSTDPRHRTAGHHSSMGRRTERCHPTSTALPTSPLPRRSALVSTGAGSCLPRGRKGSTGVCDRPSSFPSTPTARSGPSSPLRLRSATAPTVPLGRPSKGPHPASTAAAHHAGQTLGPHLGTIGPPGEIPDTIMVPVAQEALVDLGVTEVPEALGATVAHREVMVAPGAMAALGIMAVKEDMDRRRNISSNSGPIRGLPRRHRRSPSRDRWTSWLMWSTVLLPEFFW